jgi:hypothetical protein
MSHILLGLFCLENENICHQPSLATLTKQLQLNLTTIVMKGSCGTSDKKMLQIGPEPQNLGFFRRGVDRSETTISI